MKKTSIREQMQSAKKLLPKHLKAAKSALSNKKYTEALQSWALLQQAHVDSRELEQLDSHIKSFCTLMREQEKQIGLDQELHEFIDNFYRQLLQFLQSIQHAQLPLGTIKALLVDSQPSQYEAIDRYCDYLVRAATRYHLQKRYPQAIKCLLTAITQLEELIRLHYSINDPPKNMIPGEVDIMRMRQAIYYALSHHCQQLHSPDTENAFFSTKAVAKFNLCNNHKCDHTSYAEMKTLMQGTVWLLCTSKIVDYDRETGEYFQLKAKGMSLLWEKLLNGAPLSDFLTFADIKHSTESFISQLEELIFKNHLSGMLINSLKQSLFEFQQILFCINLDHYESNELTNAFTKLQHQAQQQKSEINATSLTLYHHRCAAIAMQHCRHQDTLAALTKAEEHSTSLPNNHYVQLRLWTSSAIALILNSDCDTLPSVLDKASSAFGMLSTSIYNLDHLKTLYIHYVNMLTSAFQYFRSLESLTSHIELKKKLLMQSIITVDKLGLVRKILVPEQLTEHEAIQRTLAKELNELTASNPQQVTKVPAAIESNELCVDDSNLTSAGALLERAWQYLNNKKPDAAKPLLMKIIDTPSEHPPFHLAQAFIMLSQAHVANSYSVKGIHLQQTEIKFALKACKNAYAIATENQLFEHINSIWHFLTDLQTKLINTLQHLQRLRTAFANNMSQPLEKEQPGSLNRLVILSFDTHADNFKKLLHEAKYLLNFCKYESLTRHGQYTMFNYDPRRASGVQVAPPNKLVRSNSVGSFDGIMESGNKYQVRK